MSGPVFSTNADWDTICIPLAATDSAGNLLDYTASGLPSGLSIDADTGVISGTVSGGAYTYSVTVTATDAGDVSSYESQTFTWTVASSGTITVSLTDPSDQTNLEEASPTLTLSATDSAMHSLVYGASNLPPSLAIDTSTGVISGTVSDGDSADSLYIVTVTATDSTDSSVGAGQTFNWTIDPLVTLTSPGTQANADSDTVYLPVSATDSASNPLIFTATHLPTGLSIDPNSGIISGTISAGAYAGSPYSVTVTATDYFTDTSNASQIFSWTVASSGTITVGLSLPSDQTNLDGTTPTSLTLSATDSASHSLVYGASDLPAGLSIDTSTGVISGTITEGDAAESPYAVIVTASDSTNPAIGVSQTFQWTVNPVVALSAPGSVTDADGESVSWHMAATDSADNYLVYTASGLPTGLTINSATGVISGTITAGDHSYSPYSVSVTATDGYDGSAYDSQTFTWTVDSSYSTTVSLTQPSNQSKTAGTYTSLSVSASDSASNPLTYSAIGLAPGMYINAVTGVISGTPYASDGGCTYTAIVTARDGVNQAAFAASSAFTWVVAQQPGNSGLEFRRGYPRAAIIRNVPAVQVRGNFTVPNNYTVLEGACTITINNETRSNDMLTLTQSGGSATFRGAVNYFGNYQRGTAITVVVTVRVRNRAGETLTATIINDMARTP